LYSMIKGRAILWLGGGPRPKFFFQKIIILPQICLISFSFGPFKLYIFF
jgi:hypothetical protein